MHTPRSIVRLAAAALSVGAALSLGVTATAGSGDAAPAAAKHRAHQRQFANSDRSLVVEAYRDRWLPAQDVATGWTGSVDGCDAGAPSAQAQVATLSAINYARGLAGLSPVRFSDDLNQQAQQAALMMAANGTLDHDPPSSWTCWSQVGHDASASSNLAVRSPDLTAGDTVDMYLADAGDSNVDAGHRRWILDPGLAVMGSGFTDTTNALYVFGPRRERGRTPAWVSWPSPGWFPAPLEPGGLWSLGSGDPNADFSRARVTVRDDGVKLAVHAYPSQDGYGLNTLVFQVTGAERTGRYDVVVSGIRHAAASRYSYSVRLFTP